MRSWSPRTGNAPPRGAASFTSSGDGDTVVVCFRQREPAPAAPLPGVRPVHAQQLSSHNAPVQRLHRPRVVRHLIQDRLDSDSLQLHFLKVFIIKRRRSSHRKQLCPSLVAIMGNPVNDKTIASHHGHTGAPDRDRLSDRLGLGSLTPPTDRVFEADWLRAWLTCFLVRQGRARRRTPPVEEGCPIRAGGPAVRPAPPPGSHRWCGPCATWRRSWCVW